MLLINLDSLKEDPEQLQIKLTDFVDRHSSNITLVGSGVITLVQKQDLVSALLKALEYDNGWLHKLSSPIPSLALKTLRILSRELVGFKEALTEVHLESFANHAGLGLEVAEDYGSETVIEAEKLLSNLQVHDPILREWFSTSKYPQGLPMALKVLTV